jgi:hypothetical protein
MQHSEGLDSTAPFWIIDAAVDFQSGFYGGFGGRRHFWGWVGLREQATSSVEIELVTCK